MTDTTVVIVNYKTPLLIKACYKSLRKFYPDIPVILIDNFSQDTSTKYIEAQKGKNTTVIVYKRNVGHGPALHKGVSEAKTKYAFTLDADCEILRGGFIEKMEWQLGDWPAYAIGESWEERHGPYIHPYAMLIRRAAYKKLPKFRHGGAPAIDTHRVACERGMEVIDFPIADYIRHAWQGSRGFYGWQGKEKKLDAVMKLPGKANKAELYFLIQALKMAPVGWIVGATDFRGAAAVCRSMGRKARLVDNVVILTQQQLDRMRDDLAKKLDFLPRIEYRLYECIDNIAALFLDFEQEIPEWKELTSMLASRGVIVVFSPHLNSEQTWYSSESWEFIGREQGMVAFRRRQ